MTVSPGGIIIPGQDLVLPQGVTFKEVPAYGPFRTNELIPLKGMNMLVGSIVSNGETFRLVLLPHSLTAGYIKKSKGKKGKPRHARAV